jgi:hypothetical protein
MPGAKSRPHRLIIWSPGDMGGRALRTALLNPDKFQVVGVKVFSPHKHGKDIGELVGLPPTGVKATTSKAEILALDADCVIHTPTTPSLLKGSDHDVLDLLASGKNVVSGASHHNPSMHNWLSESQSALSVLRTVGNMKVTGNIFKPQEKQALAALRRIMQAVDSKPGQALHPMLEKVGSRLLEKVLPRRVSGARFQEACLKGKSSLFGTGLHPGIMVEQVVLRLAGLLEEVERIHFLEVGDLSAAPDGMWGGLSSLGFGCELHEVDSNHAIALMQHFYFNDVLGNVAHELYGAGPERIRVERHVYPSAARVEVKAGGTVIKPGTVGSIHMTYRGYIDDRLFMTNEECWHVGAGNAHLGPDHPNSLAGGHIITIDGKPGRIEFRSEPDDDSFKADWSAVTDISVNAILSSIPGVCAAAPGVLTPDLTPRYSLEEA